MGSKLESSLAVLNGAIGDYLAKTRNGLATETEVFASASGGPPLTLERAAMVRALTSAPRKLVVLVHGLMCTESIWQMPDGADYGSLLAADLGYRPFYVRYNTGLPLAESGARLARALQSLARSYPGPIDEIVAVGHSMGGLVVRSACHAGRLDGLDGSWLGRLRRAIYLGTPHLGSPLERIGRVVTKVLRSVPDPYARLVAEIADLRSGGIKDLGDGLRDPHHPIPLLPEMEHYLVAASLSDDPWLATLFGDALVPVGSATNGAHSPMSGVLPPSHVRVIGGSGHISLAHDRDVYACIRTWCEGAS